MKRSTVIRTLFAAGGGLLAIVAVLLSGAEPFYRALVIAGAVLPIAGLVLDRFSAPARRASRSSTDSSQPSADPQAAFETWREQATAELELECERLDARWKSLNERTLQYRELFEYPSDPTLVAEQQTPERSAQDRQVSVILEKEAARVYEKIRANGYTNDGRLDIEMIRNEVIDVVNRVTRVYKPDSTNPLLETSFEQLARSASRVCLHALVLVEQLPLDVQSYNINQLYGYVRKGITAWGHWQTVSPWVKQISRGLYAGRLAASTNPVTLGTWWLASEIGRHGARKIVNDVVDRHAIAFFNDIVRLVGTEVACVFGPGIRQRDPAWIYGTELTELMHWFPLSRDSLSAALRQVTALPLRSEYDRIYLYRCLAQHQPSGFRLADPAVLTREEREDIAHRLEQFFQQFVHGTKPKEVTAWSESVHDRLDLRLQLAGESIPAMPSGDPQEIVISIHGFLTNIAGLDAVASVMLLRDQAIFRSLDTETGEQLASQLSLSQSAPFDPPDIDPADPLTSVYLKTLAECCAAGNVYDSHVEELIVETGRYFRRGAEEMRAMVHSAWNERLVERTRPDAPGDTGAPAFARSILQQLQNNEMVTSLYTNVSCEPELRISGATSPECCVVSVEGLSGRRVMLFGHHADTPVLWEAGPDLQVERLSGLVLDDCALRGGHWHVAPRESTTIRVSGRFARGGYEKWFRPLL